MKILIVDDDPNIVELLLLVLNNEGFEDVQCVSSSSLALSKLKTAKPIFDLLLLDIEMPGMNGIDLCKQARLLPEYKNVPVTMLTARRDDKTIREAIEAGATDYVTKPFDVMEIGVRIRMSAQLVRAHRAINYLSQPHDSGADRVPVVPKRVTREEIVNIFADDLYHSQRG